MQWKKVTNAEVFYPPKPERHSQVFPFHVPPLMQVTGVAGEALRVGVEVLFTVTVDELVETVVEVVLCVLGFIPAVEVERVVVVTILEVTEVEEEEVVVGLVWPVDIGKVVSETIVENVLASERLVTGEVVAKGDVAGVLG